MEPQAFFSEPALVYPLLNACVASAAEFGAQGIGKQIGELLRSVLDSVVALVVPPHSLDLNMASSSLCNCRIFLEHRSTSWNLSFVWSWLCGSRLRLAAACSSVGRAELLRLDH